MLLGPARILVFLPVFRWIFLPDRRGLAGLHILIFVTAISLLENWNDRRINHLAAASDIALPVSMLLKTLKQFLDETGLRKSPGITKASCRRECYPQCQAAETA